MEDHRKKNLEVSNSKSYSLFSYDEIYNNFHEIHVEALNDFKKITSQKKNILIL